jgi:hypothetical protein
MILVVRIILVIVGIILVVIVRIVNVFAHASAAVGNALNAVGTIRLCFFHPYYVFIPSSKPETATIVEMDN